MSGHIDFGNDGDVAFGRVGNNFAEIFLGVETTVGDVVVFGSVAPDDGFWSYGADFGEPGILLDFDSPALVIGEMEVEGIDLEQGEVVYELEDFCFGGEMPGDVEHDSAPLESGLVGDGEAWDLPEGGLGSSCVVGDREELAEGLNSVEEARFGGGGDCEVFGGGDEFVAFGVLLGGRFKEEGDCVGCFWTGVECITGCGGECFSKVGSGDWG